jgi:hypothetical protein
MIYLTPKNALAS